jgi:hypothetical protein
MGNVARMRMGISSRIEWLEATAEGAGDAVVL